MSRRRKTKVSKQRPLEPDDVLDGRVEPRLEDLFDLIHRVNPTGEGRHKKEEARRYRLKNQLQSLLIRRFGDEHLKLGEDARPGVVSLEHISGARDACHAVVAELDDDARSWIRLQLDLAASGGEDDDAELFGAMEIEDGDGTSGDLLHEGRRALEEYDYERGEELLRQAFSKSRGGAETQHAAAAQALLELQVDLLGLDQAALELEPRLSRSARERPAIRTLLALAAARQGDAERALGLVAGLTPVIAGLSLPRAAEVYVALAAGAIRARDRGAARSYLERVAEYDPTHARIVALEAEIDALRAEDRHAEEVELERRFQELGAAAVEAEARALADRWPEGEVARGILRQLAAERRAAEIAEHLARAEAARETERFADAARHFRAAEGAGSERPDLADLAGEMEDLARQESERRALDAVIRRFADGKGEAGRREALLAYLALAEELRARVRGRIDQPALGWLEELETPRGGQRAQAAVTAVMALEQARVDLERGAAREALAQIEPHRALLRRVKVTGEVWRGAHAKIAEERRHQALERIEAAEVALGEGRIADARQVLDQVPRGALHDGDEQALTALWARIDDAEGLDRSRREYREHRQAGDLTGALAAATKLARSTHEDPAADPKDWLENVADLQRRIRAEWRFEEVETADLDVEQALQPSHWLEPSCVWLDDDGRELVLVNARDRWLFIDVVDVARRAVVARVSFRAPRPFERPLLTRRHGERLWIAGRHGGLVELEREGWNVLAYHDLTQLVPEGRIVERVYPMPGTSRLWVRVSEDWGREQICIVDLDRGRLVRRLPFDSALMVPMLTGDEPRMLLTGKQMASRFYSADGEPLSSERLVRGSVLDVDRGPSGDGLLLLEMSAGYGPDVDREIAVVLLAEGPEGESRETARLELDEAHLRVGFHDSVVTSPDRGAGYVYYRTQADVSELLIFATSKEPGSQAPLEPISRTRWPSQMTLVHDRSGRHVGAMEFGDDGVEVLFLDPPPGPPAEEPQSKRRKFPQVKVYSHSCGQPSDEAGEKVRELAEELEGRTDKALRTLLVRAGISKTMDVEEKIRLVHAIQLKQVHYKVKGDLTGLARRLAREYPRHAGAVLIQADLDAIDENWTEVATLLDGVEPVGLDASRARHFHHLVGLTHFHAGRQGEAHEAFRRGLEHEGRCELESLVQLTAPMADPPEVAEWSPEQPPICRLLGAIRTADHAFEAGDAAAERAALDRQDMRWYQELQTAARRARAYLRARPKTAAERFDQRSALAFYFDLRQQEDYMRQNVFLPGLHWGEERLEEIDEEVTARLEELASLELGPMRRSGGSESG